MMTKNIHLILIFLIYFIFSPLSANESTENIKRSDYSAKVKQIEELKKQLEKKRKEKCQENPNLVCRKFVSAKEKDPRYIAYMNTFVEKIHLVANNIFFKEHVKKEKINNFYGRAIVDVAVKSDGTLSEVTIRKSSNNKALDNAIIEVVNLAKPFELFPESFKNEVDILHITRTWSFIENK